MKKTFINFEKKRQTHAENVKAIQIQVEVVPELGGLDKESIYYAQCFFI